MTQRRLPRRSSNSARVAWMPNLPCPPGESAGGVSPPAALRTGRDGLPSSGPRSPALGERDEPASGRTGQACTDTPFAARPSLWRTCRGSPELVHGPPGEVLVDAPCQEAQLGAVEGSVIVDP